MKVRWHDKDIWNLKEFRDLQGWAKLLYYYMYDIADHAGLVQLDLGLAEYCCKMSLPQDVGEIERELSSTFVRVGEDLFLIKYFIETTQGTKGLKLHNPPHACVIRDMVERHKRGFKDVMMAVRYWNPSLKVQTLAEAKEEVNDMNKRAGNDQRKIDGLKGRVDSVKNIEKDLGVLGYEDFPQIKEYTEEELRTLEFKEDDHKAIESSNISSEHFDNEE